MGNLRNYIYNFRQAILHKETVVFIEDGITYEIGSGSYNPYPRPQMVYHWHPPVETLPLARSEPDARGLRNLIKRFGIWKKST